jgi:hypothetical protein
MDTRQEREKKKKKKSDIKGEPCPTARNRLTPAKLLQANGTMQLLKFIATGLLLGSSCLAAASPATWQRSQVGAKQYPKKVAPKVFIVSMVRLSQKEKSMIES